MYNINYECRYHKDNIFLDTDDINDYERAHVKHILYNEDFLNIFDIDRYDDEIINERISFLYKKLEIQPDLKECMLKLAANFLSEDIEIGLMLLFSYDYMYMSHKCICEFINSGQISEKNISELRSAIFI
jgi:hypothetical protein